MAAPAFAILNFTVISLSRNASLRLLYNIRLLLFLFIDRYRHGDTGAAAFARRDVESAVTHHFKTLADVIQGDMRLVVVGRIKAGTVVLDGDFVCRLRLPCDDGNMDGALLFRMPCTTAFSTMG